MHLLGKHKPWDAFVIFRVFEMTSEKFFQFQEGVFGGRVMHRPKILTKIRADLSHDAV